MRIRKENLITITVLFLVLVFAVYYRNFSKATPSNNVTVILNDSGFSPDNITILKGTTVTWISQGTRLHWPASNPHPQHTGYPGGGGCIGSKFDACRGLKNGETYSFQFNILGSWGAHDHLFPGSVMAINVVDKLSSTTVQTVVGTSVTKAEFMNMNYSGQLETIKSMATADPIKAWAFLKDAFIINGQVVGNAHELAHIVGNQAFEKFGLDGVKVCDDSFAFGCFHGVTEMMLLKEGVSQVKSIQDQCLKIFPPDKSQDYTGCIHGMGHGLYTWESGNLKKSLSDCDIIDEPYSQYCYDGVFMENSNYPASRVFDPNDPWKFCSDLDNKYGRNCARYQVQIFLGAFGSPNSLTQVGKDCASGPTDILKSTCFESLGYYVAQTYTGKVPDMLKACSQMPDTPGVEMCTDGAATETVFQRYLGFESSSKQMCKTLSEPRQTACLNNTGSMIKQNIIETQNDNQN